MKKIQIRKRNVPFILFVSFCLVVFFIIGFIVRPVSINGPSMEDTLFSKDWVFLWEWGYTPQRGDVVMINIPEQGLVVKRIIGLQGDHLQVSTGTVKIDGVEVDEPYIKENNWDTDEFDLVISGEHVFVMGDNRNQSIDSRVWGLINYNQIKGKVI